MKKKPRPRFKSEDKWLRIDNIRILSDWIWYKSPGDFAKLSPCTQLMRSLDVRIREYMQNHHPKKR